MLALGPKSNCNVCFQTFNEKTVPNAIPCGHTFCALCLSNISKNLWSPRAAPTCPLCRKPFSSDSIVAIRIDEFLSSSPVVVFPYPSYFPELKSGAVPLDEEAVDNDPAVADEAKRLEAKVKGAAKRKCTFEELSSLQLEIKCWLAQQRTSRPGCDYPVLSVASDLLMAILVNDSRSKKEESEWKEKLDGAALDRRRMEDEIHRMKLEISKLAGPLPPPLAAPKPPVPIPRPLRPTSSVVPLPPSHAHAMRSQTPGLPPTQRATTPGPKRSQTPATAALGSAYLRGTATTSHLPTSLQRGGVGAGGGGGHGPWKPTTSPEDGRDGGRPGAKPGIAHGHHPHARTSSLGAGGGAGMARPQTAAGWIR